ASRPFHPPSALSCLWKWPREDRSTHQGSFLFPCSVQTAVINVFKGGGLQSNELYTLNENISAKDTQMGEKGADLDGGARKSARHLSHTSYSTLLTVLRDNHCSQCIVYPQNDGQEKQNSLSKVTQL
ncbi:hypothetical protein J1605_002722, partial [Eschrichtius robustus]